MNKYHEGKKAQWVRAMVDSGWVLLMTSPYDMWLHADESVFMPRSECVSYFRRFVNYGDIPSPYEVEHNCRHDRAAKGERA